MMNRPRLVLIALLLASFSLAAVSFALKPRKEEGVETLRLLTGPPSVDYLPQYIAREKNFFAEEGLNVQVKSAADEDALPAALADGRAEIILTGLERAIYARSEGRAQTVAFAALTAADGTYLLARRATGTFKWTDLKEKTVITGRPDSRETVLLEGILRRHGIAPNRDVTLYTNIPARLRAGAFLSGSGDFILAGEPLATQLAERQAGTVVAVLGREAGPLPAVVYVTTEETARKRARALQRFARAVYRAQLWLAGHDAGEAAALAAPYLTGVDRAQLVNIIERYRAMGLWAADPRVPREGYRVYMNLLEQAREVPGPLDYRTMVDAGPAAAAVNEVRKRLERESRPWYAPLLKIVSW